MGYFGSLDVRKDNGDYTAVLTPEHGKGFFPEVGCIQYGVMMAVNACEE
jgi:hypothetical protein